MAAPESTPRAEMRLGQVHGAVDRLSTALDDAAPPHRSSLHALVNHLHDALGHAHRHSDEVDGGAWADYVDRLDRGVDEMHLELARAAERPAEAPTVSEVAFARVSRLELDGWRLRFDVHGSRSDLLHRAEQEISSFEQGAEASADPAREPVRQALDAVRDEVGDAGRA